MMSAPAKLAAGFAIGQEISGRYAWNPFRRIAWEDRYDLYAYELLGK